MKMVFGMIFLIFLYLSSKRSSQSVTENPFEISPEITKNELQILVKDLRLISESEKNQISELELLSVGEKYHLSPVEQQLFDTFYKKLAFFWKLGSSKLKSKCGPVLDNFVEYLMEESDFQIDEAFQDCGKLRENVVTSFKEFANKRSSLLDSDYLKCLDLKEGDSSC